MALTKEELRHGMDYWKNKTNWPGDFHFNLYRELEIKLNRANIIFDKSLIDVLMPHLSSWIAMRPKSKAFIKESFINISDSLQEAWDNHISSILNNEIDKVSAETVNGFINKVKNIKNVQSPVFPSKFCHFLVPWIFPIIDNKAIKKHFKSYIEYFIFAQKEWNQTSEDTRKELENYLKNEIKKETQVIKYPFKTKIIELCLIGRANY